MCLDGFNFSCFLQEKLSFYLPSHIAGADDEGPRSWEVQVAAFCVTQEFVKELVKTTRIYKLPLKASFCRGKKEPAEDNLVMTH